MNSDEKEKLLVEEIKRAIEAVVCENSAITDDCDARLEKYFCKKIKKIYCAGKDMVVDFYRLPSLKFEGAEIIFGKELLNEGKIKRINFIKIIKRNERLLFSAMVEVKSSVDFDFLEFYADKFTLN